MEYYLDCNETISRKKMTRKRSAMPRAHYHREYELYYMLDGRVTYFVGDEIYHIDKGDFVFIPQGILHRTAKEHSESNERILLSIDPKVFQGKAEGLLEKMGGSPVIHVPESCLPELEELLRKIEAEFLRQEGKFLMELYILELLTLLCRYRCERKPNIKPSDEIVYRISDYIHDHYEKPLTLEILGELFSISEGYLSRKFKTVTGMGIAQYITYVRVSAGEKLLQETELSVTEVAARCGFSDSNYFSAVFKKIKGVSPLAYRKQKRLPEERGFAKVSLSG